MIYKVITFNMCHGDNNNGIIDVKNQANILKQYDLDLVLLQEVDICTERSKFINELDEFKKSIGLKYSCYGTNIPYKEGWYGNAILSKYPILSSENFLSSFTEYSKEPKGMLHAEIEVNEKIIHAFNTHLPVYAEERELFVGSIMKMMERNAISGDMILGGDFNLGVIPGSGRHEYTLSKSDSYKEFETLKKIFNCPDFTDDTWPTGDLKGDIDKILYCGDIKLDVIKRLDVEISDHHPVYAEFTI